jgi:hypothetical protein
MKNPTRKMLTPQTSTTEGDQKIIHQHYNAKLAAEMALGGCGKRLRRFFLLKSIK